MNNFVDKSSISNTGGTWMAICSKPSLPGGRERKNRAVRKTCTTIWALLLCQLLFAQFHPPEFPSDTIFTHAEQMPYFTGCEEIVRDSLEKRRCSDRELSHFISRHLVYPVKAMHEGIEGTVLMSFIIDRSGAVCAPAVLMDIGGGCGEAALDVIKEMPKWEPAVHDGETVTVRMNMPIQFFLRAENRDKSERYSLTWGSLRGNTASREELEKNIGRPVYVRSPEGIKCYIDELEFIFEKDNRTVSASSRGEISEDIRKVVDRSKRNGQLTIRASIQENGQFVTVSRSFRIIK